MPINPITPKEVVEKAVPIPEEVISCFNELIQKHFIKGVATIDQKEILDLICAKLNVSSEVVFKKHWLDVEEIYKAAGWKVEYEAPCRDESFPEFFRFGTKK